jgi:hypothetical protein
VFSSIILGAAILSGFSYVAAQVTSFSLFTKYTKSWLLKQAGPLKAEMVKSGLEIIKLPLESWNELSIGYERVSSKFSFKGIEIGVIKSIFYENLMLIGKKSQLGFGNGYTMLVLVDDIELLLVNTRNDVKVFINNNKIGVIQKLKMTYQTTTGVKAVINTSIDGKYHTLEVNGSKVGYLNPPSRAGNPFNTRLIEHIDNNCEEEFVRAMPLIIYYLMKDKS